MTRTFYFLVPLAAICLLMLAQIVGQARPGYAPSTQAPPSVAPAVAVPDAARTALDDLAAWPAAAGR